MKYDLCIWILLDICVESMWVYDIECYIYMFEIWVMECVDRDV